jgi:hypothetical protein
MILIRRIASQQVCQCGSRGMVHGRSGGGLDCFQVESAIVAAAFLENQPQQAVYFAGNLSLDRFGRFFSWAVCSV